MLRRNKHSTQELLGIHDFTEYGLSTKDGELLLFQVAPINISVLSQANVRLCVRHLMTVLAAFPELELCCTDASECFDDNKAYLQKRLQEETNPKIRALLKRDIAFLDRAQTEMSTARQFLFLLRCKGMKAEQVFQTANRVEKLLAEQNFEVHRLRKPEIKRFLAISFGTSMEGDKLPDVDGAQYLEEGSLC